MFPGNPGPCGFPGPLRHGEARPLPRAGLLGPVPAGAR